MICRRNMLMLLEAKNINKSFGGLTAVDGIDFSLDTGQIVSIIGPNGAGKTTFFNIISGLYKPDKGILFFNGEDITSLNPEKIAHRGIARTFQTSGFSRI
jgi:branched-chain amino acid transport system ATP-binding protein